MPVQMKDDNVTVEELVPDLDRVEDVCGSMSI